MERCYSHGPVCVELRLCIDAAKHHCMTFTTGELTSPVKDSGSGFCLLPYIPAGRPTRHAILEIPVAVLVGREAFATMLHPGCGPGLALPSRDSRPRFIRVGVQIPFPGLGPQLIDCFGHPLAPLEFLPRREGLLGSDTNT